MKGESVQLLAAAGACTFAAGLTPYTHGGAIAGAMTVMSVMGAWFFLYGVYATEQRTEDLPPVGGGK